MVFRQGSFVDAHLFTLAGACSLARAWLRFHSEACPLASQVEFYLKSETKADKMGKVIDDTTVEA